VSCRTLASQINEQRGLGADSNSQNPFLYVFAGVGIFVLLGAVAVNLWWWEVARLLHAHHSFPGLRKPPVGQPRSLSPRDLLWRVPHRDRRATSLLLRDFVPV